MALVSLPPFLSKLVAITETCDKAVADWNEDGTQFVVKLSDRFENEILKQYFKGTKSSFFRQLHFYNFKKLDTKGSSWAFEHPKFRRNSPFLVYEIRRKTRAEASGPASRDEVQSLRNETVQLGKTIASLQEQVGAIAAQLEKLVKTRTITGEHINYSPNDFESEDQGLFDTKPCKELSRPASPVMSYEKNYRQPKKRRQEPESRINYENRTNVGLSAYGQDCFRNFSSQEVKCVRTKADSNKPSLYLEDGSEYGENVDDPSGPILPLARGDEPYNSVPYYSGGYDVFPAQNGEMNCYTGSQRKYYSVPISLPCLRNNIVGSETHFEVIYLCGGSVSPSQFHVFLERFVNHFRKLGGVSTSLGETARTNQLYKVACLPNTCPLKQLLLRSSDSLRRVLIDMIPADAIPAKPEDDGKLEEAAKGISSSNEQFIHFRCQKVSQEVSYDMFAKFLLFLASLIQRNEIAAGAVTTTILPFFENFVNRENRQLVHGNMDI